jgi:hypothetical protein
VLLPTRDFLFLFLSIATQYSNAKLRFAFMGFFLRGLRPQPPAKGNAFGNLNL